MDSEESSAGLEPSNTEAEYNADERPDPFQIVNRQQVHQAQAQENQELKRIRKVREFVPLFCVVVIPLLASFRLKEMAEQSIRTGDFFVFVSKCVLYVPSIAYTFAYPILTLYWLKCRNYPMEKHASIASFALRLLTSFFGVCIVFFELKQLLKCGPDDENVCITLVQIERGLKMALFGGLSLFVYLDRFYPRRTKWNLFCLTYLLSATCFTYVLTMAAELKHIHHEIVERNNHTEQSYLPVQRAYADWKVSPIRDYKLDGSHDFKDIPEIFWDGLIEAVYSATSEFLVVTISIIIGIICLTGEKEREPDEEKHELPRGKMALWICFVVICALVLVCILVVLNIKKADHDSFWTKMFFFIIHVVVLIAGIAVCVFLFGRSIDGNEDRQPLLDDDQPAQEEVKKKTPTEILDRNLLNFGTIGFFSYASIGLVHSAYLIPTAYSTIFAYGSVATDVFSMIQGFVQTTVILHCDMVKNKFGFVAGITLWFVNFVMFSLDLFDAATLGIYANPVPKGSNEMWTMLVRGLGLFVVFYRFHSLAIISDLIEHHLHWKQTLDCQSSSV